MAARPASRLALLRHKPTCHALSSTQQSPIPRIPTQYSLTSSSQHRLSHSTTKHVAASQIPPPTAFVPDVATFLKLIGRQSSQFASKLQTWETLFAASSESLRVMGVEPPRARRYLLHWRDKFRRGEFGPGGDLVHVSGDGVAELRVVPHGKHKIVINTPVSTEDGQEWKKEPPTDAVRVPWAKVAHPGIVAAPYAVPIKGTEGKVARLTVAEGMWEHRRGHKVGGGERWMTRQKTLADRRKRGIVA